jgi:hypothetical protein
MSPGVVAGTLAQAAVITAPSASVDTLRLPTTFTTSCSGSCLRLDRRRAEAETQLKNRERKATDERFKH